MAKGGWNKGKPSPLRGRGRCAQWVFDHADYAGNDCLQWPFHVDVRVQRGRMGYKGKMWWAHRFMCEVAHGPPPSDLHQAAHNCGNGHLKCINPQHLEWKTNQENSQDKITHGRAREKAGKKELTPAEIAELQALKGKMVQTKIAERFGVSLSCVQYHLHGKDRWPSHGGRLSQQLEAGK